MSPADKLTQMAFEIADSAARSDVECHCRGGWYGAYYDTRAESLKEEDREFVAIAVSYLTRRNKLNRHPDYPHLVNFEGVTQ